jgi:acetyltransferase-like isoleucine patch superfamily enzyme
MKYFCHDLSDIQSTKIGEGTTLWQFVVVLPEAEIGKNCNINSHVFIENDVLIGNNVTVKSGVQIWNGIILEDNVFIGPNVTFTNDIIPRSKQYPQQFEKTIIKKGASIGANATIIAGNEIGEFSLIGAGAVVTKSIGKNELWVGNPAKIVGYITRKGEILDMNLIHKESNKKYMWNNNYDLVEIDD